MLRATHRVLRPGGRTAFYMIHPAPRLSAAELQRAIEAGPSAVALGEDPADLLREAGFRAVRSHDRTAAFLETARAWRDRSAERAGALRRAMGAAAFEQRQAQRSLLVDAIREGLLRRALLVARA